MEILQGQWQALVACWPSAHSNMVRSKRLEAFAQFHQRSLHVLHLLADVVVVMLLAKALTSSFFDHLLMSQDVMPNVVDAPQMQEKQFAVLRHMLLGQGGMIVFQDGGKEFVLKKLDLVLEEVQLTDPLLVVVV
jgi:hypothetical protein